MATNKRAVGTRFSLHYLPAMEKLCRRPDEVGDVSIYTIVVNWVRRHRYRYSFSDGFRLGNNNRWPRPALGGLHNVDTTKVRFIARRNGRKLGLDASWDFGWFSFYFIFFFIRTKENACACLMRVPRGRGRTFCTCKTASKSNVNGDT